MNGARIFDVKIYDDLNAARGAVVSSLLSELKAPLGLGTAVDVACGAGFFSNLLKSLGLEVTGVDGRQQNVEDSTGRLLLVEGVIFPGDEPIMGLVDETPSDDQGLNYFAFYPTEACLQKMLYKSGFVHVYRFRVIPDHPGYHETKRLPRVRTMLAASHKPISTRFLELVPEPSIYFAPWDAGSVAASRNSLEKLRRFVGKPLPRKIESIRKLIEK